MNVFTSLRAAPAFAALLLACTLGAAPAASPAPADISAGDVIAHLARTISWFRHVDTALDTSTVANDALLHDTTHRTSVKALQLAFDFARAESSLLAASKPSGNGSGSASSSGSRNLDQAAQRAAERVTSMQARINEIDAAKGSAPPAARERLAAQRNELEAQLRLALEVQKTIQSVMNFAGGSGSGMGGELSAQISQMENLVPEAAQSTANANGKPAPRSPSPNQPPLYQPESAGLFTLVSEFIALSGSDTKTTSVIAETDKLLAQIERLRAPLTAEIRNSISRSEQLTSDSSSETVEQMNGDRHEIENLSVRFKQLSTALVPLREQQIMMSATRTNLNEMRSTAARLRSDTTRYLLLRSATLAVVIFLLLGMSAVWRRVTFRYVKDVRRRRQFMLLRRVVLIFAVVLVLSFGFISDFGSLATYAGFLTAGIAVALQNVILAVVAYFFLIGRYGVRIGDRVTVAGVTGKVIDIGLVRIYLMEYAGSLGDMHPTGRIVVFSNAVLFQPSALYKQMPGADFVWRTVTLTLEPDVPLEKAKTALSAAVDSVYEKYREAIEKQHAALEQSVDLQMSVPHPSCRLRFSDTGLEFTAHYPTEIQHAAANDDLVMRALHDAVAADPALKLAPGGAPKLVQQ